MSKIEELISKYCPQGVEYKELVDIFSLKNGYTPSTSNSDYWKNGSIPWFRMEDIRLNGNVLSDSIQKISEKAVKGGRLFPKNSILIATSATIGDHVLITVPHLSNQRFTSISLKSEYDDLVDIKFVFYYCFLLGEWCRNNVTTSSFASVDMRGFKKFKFPIPPLPVQKEIVRILDKFTALEAELEAELEARTRQYDYYRNQLLAFEGVDVQWKVLGEVANYSKNRIAANEINLDSYVGVDNLLQNKKGKTFSSYVPTTGNLTHFIDGDILIGNIRPYLKKIWKSNISGGTNGDVLVIRISDKYKIKLIPDYLYYLLSSDSFFDYNMQYAKGAKMPRGDKDSILKYPIPIPQLSEQERIVAILDKFDALVNDISVGLPAEIQARRQQYEYYRGKLLTFEPLVVSPNTLKETSLSV